MDGLCEWILGYLQVVGDLIRFKGIVLDKEDAEFMACSDKNVLKL